MSFMRYTAVTCGPSNFMKYKYNIRQALYTPPRETEIMVCITMYNEDEILLARTLKGIFDNIKNLTNRNDSKWGEDSWKKIVVCIISDGRVDLNKRSQELLTALGLYQDGYAKSKINDKSVKSHIYEYTSTVGIETINDKIHFCTNSSPVQFLFCLKEKIQEKLTRIDGVFNLSHLSSNQRLLCYWIVVRSHQRTHFIICGNHSTILMLQVHVVK